jgi:proliferating cell nuclear antigen PCNA
MFEARLNDVSLLRDSIATISELIDETELHITKEGIKMISADRAVVAVVDFFLSSEAFDEYKYDKDARIGINLLSFLQILRRAGANDALQMKLLDNRLELVLKGESTRRFTLPLIDISKEETPPLDKLEFPTTMRINSEILNSGIEDAELVTDSIVFTLSNDQFMMKADSDSSSAQLELVPGSELNITKLKEPVRARYSLDYLKKIFKARKLAEEASIAMATDYPMKIQFDVEGKMQLTFILAPRVEEG